MRMMIVLPLAVLFACGGCNKPPSSERSAPIVPSREITRVMDAHVDELMMISGVAGVAIGELKDGTPCIQVLVVERTNELLGKIPKTLEGYPVDIVVSGVIKPL